MWGIPAGWRGIVFVAWLLVQIALTRAPTFAKQRHERRDAS
jgi:hypothetical protein